jgi:hypothetical protein
LAGGLRATRQNLESAAANVENRQFHVLTRGDPVANLRAIRASDRGLERGLLGHSGVEAHPGSAVQDDIAAGAARNEPIPIRLSCFHVAVEEHRGLGCQPRDVDVRSSARRRALHSNRVQPIRGSEAQSPAELDAIEH